MIFLALVGFVLALHSAALSDLPYVGVSLHESHIAVATVRESSEPETTTFPHSGLHQAWHTAPSSFFSWFVQGPKSLDSALHDAFHAADRILGKRKDEAHAVTLAIPPKILRSTEKLPAFKAYLEKQFNRKVLFDKLDLISHTTAIHYAYSLGACEAIGQPPGCDYDELDPHIVMLQYDDSGLKAHICEAGLNSCHSVADAKFPDIKPESPNNYGLILRSVDSFIQKSTLASESAAKTETEGEPEHTPLRSSIKAVVLSGNSGEDSRDTLRRAVVRLMTPIMEGLDHIWLRDQLDPVGVAAIGAAQRARDRTVNKGRFLINVYPVQDPAEHNEL